MNVSKLSSVISAVSGKNLSVLRACALTMRTGILVNLSRSAPTSDWGAQLSHALSLAANWEGLGFEASTQLIYAMSHASVDELVAIHKQMTPELTKMVGAHRAYAPMYPNFPKQVMQMSDLELFMNANMHYLGDALGLRILPLYQVKERNPKIAKRDVQHRPLRCVTVDDLAQEFYNTLTMTTAWSPTVRTCVQNLVAMFKDNADIYKGVLVPNKENLGVLGAALHRVNVGSHVITPSLSSITDVLRICVALGSTEGDVSLVDKTKMRLGSLKRGWRRMALSFMETTKDQAQLLENMNTRRSAFVRLGEVLHPGEYAERYAQAYQAFNALRNPRQFRALSYNAKLEKAFSMGTSGMDDALSLLQTRPGVFARRIVALLSLANPKARQRALESFSNASAHVATPLLLQMRAFIERGLDHAHRTYLPKGAVSCVYVRNKPKHTLDDELRLMLLALIDGALHDKFFALPALGKVYMSPDVRKMLMPYGLRNAAAGVKTMVRGSRIPLGVQGGDTVRCFMWWKEPEYDRVDLDLSVVLLDENGNTQEHCSWTQLRGNGLTHSGDITSAPNGACEFIDVDLGIVSQRARYMLMVVNAYTNTPFKDLPEAFAGWMVRKKGQRGEIFDARTVHHKADLQTNARVAMPMMLDLHTKEAVWMDIGVKCMAQVSAGYSYSYGRRTKQVENQGTYMQSAVKGLATLAKPTLGEVVDAHVRARGGQFVEDKSQADLVIDWDGDLTPFDHATWASQWAGE